jgi:hypothetical protein
MWISVNRMELEHPPSIITNQLSKYKERIIYGAPSFYAHVDVTKSSNYPKDKG